MKQVQILLFLIAFCFCKKSFIYTQDIISKIKKTEEMSTLNKDWPFYKCSVLGKHSRCPDFWNCFEENCIPDIPGHWEFKIEEMKEKICFEERLKFIQLKLDPNSEVSYNQDSYGLEVFLKSSDGLPENLKKGDIMRIAPDNFSDKVYKVYFPLYNHHAETELMNEGFCEN